MTIMLDILQTADMIEACENLPQKQGRFFICPYRKPPSSGAYPVSASPFLKVICQNKTEPEKIDSYSGLLCIFV
jgi:hypothetical protein